VTSSSQPGKPPANYTEVLYWRITDQAGRLLKINLLALPLAVVSSLAFVSAARQFGKAPKLAWPAGESVVFVGGLFVVLALHEWVHGLLMQTYGAKPRYGFFVRGGMFYAKAPGYPFTRQQYLVVLLGPLVGLSLLACLLIGLLAGSSTVWLVALWAILNASAANADLWITGVVLKHPAEAYVVDERDGLRILLPSGDPRAQGPGGRSL